MKKILFISLGAVVLLLLSAVGFWFWLNAAVTKGFTDGIGAGLQARASFGDVHLDLLGGKIVVEDGILQNLDPQASWNEVRIGHGEASFKMSDVFQKTTPTTIELDKVKLTLGAPANQPLALAPEAPAPAELAKQANSWPHIVVRQFALHQGSIVGDTQHPFNSSGLEIVAENTPGSSEWKGDFKAQTLSVEYIKFGVTTAHFSTTDTDIQVDKYQLLLGDGTITGQGKIPKDLQQPAQIGYEFTSVPSNLLLPSDTGIILGGLLQAKGDYQGSITDLNKGETKGHASLHPAGLKVLPFLDTLAEVPGMDGLKTIGKSTEVPGMSGLGHMELDTAQTDYDYKNGTITLTNLRLEKAATIALTGDVSLTPDGQMGGTVKLGLPTAIVGVIPKLKEEVFNTDAENYSWADVKISGTSDHLVEDLTPRVLGAIGDQGKQLLQGAAKGASDLLNLLNIQPKP